MTTHTALTLTDKRALMDNTYLMVDFETLALDNPVIIEMGLVVFNKDEILHKFSRTYDPEKMVAMGMNVSIDTIKWWLSYDKEMFTEKIKGEASPIDLLDDLINVFVSFNCTKIVSNGSRNDITWLHQLRAKVEEKTGAAPALPWSYSDELCFRTLRQTLPPLHVDNEGLISHEALSDALWQAKYMQALLQVQDKKSLPRYLELLNDETSGLSEESSLEKLRFFLSLALSSNDWLDVEPLLADVEKELATPRSAS